MATQDGYSPYPLGLTAAQASAAINRAHNLSNEFAGYLAYKESATPPTLASGIKEGDLWHNSTNGIFYRTFIDTTTTPNTVLYFEV